MALIHRATVTADGNSEFNWLGHRKDVAQKATLWVTGPFGGGTVTLRGSPDGGTTFVDIPDPAGNPIVFTTAGITNFELGVNNNPIAADIVKLRLVLAGATSPSVTYHVQNHA